MSKEFFSKQEETDKLLGKKIDKEQEDIYPLGTYFKDYGFFIKSRVNEKGEKEVLLAAIYGKIGDNIHPWLQWRPNDLVKDAAEVQCKKTAITADLYPISKGDTLLFAVPVPRGYKPYAYKFKKVVVINYVQADRIFVKVLHSSDLHGKPIYLALDNRLLYKQEF